MIWSKASSASLRGNARQLLRWNRWHSARQVLERRFGSLLHARHVLPVLPVYRTVRAVTPHATKSLRPEIFFKRRHHPINSRITNDFIRPSRLGEFIRDQLRRIA